MSTRKDGWFSQFGKVWAIPESAERPEDNRVIICKYKIGEKNQI